MIVSHMDPWYISYHQESAKKNHYNIEKLLTNRIETKTILSLKNYIVDKKITYFSNLFIYIYNSLLNLF